MGASPPAAPSQGGTWAPSGSYLRADENLRVTSYNALASVVLAVRARVYEADGTVTDSFDSHTPLTNRSAQATIIRTPEGWLLGGEVFVSSASPLIGQTFVVVEIVRGESTAGIATQLLAAGYVTAKQPLLFPQVAPQSSLDGGGALRSITGTTPAAGAEISETVPTGARWELLAFAATLTTSAAVANRTPLLIVDDGANDYYRDTVTTTQTASLAIRYLWGPGVAIRSGTNNNLQNGSTPVGMRLGGGHRLRTSTTSIQGADQWGGVQYLVREWIEGS